MHYRPGTRAKLSTLVAAAGWFLELWFASQRGADITQAAFLNVLFALLLAVVPMVVGTLCFYLGRYSQRAGDIGFSTIMIAQGLALAAAGVAGG